MLDIERVVEMKPRIKEIIADRGYKHIYVANKVGVSSQQMSNWISGNSYPRIEKLFALAKVLDCKIEDLYDE